MNARAWLEVDLDALLDNARTLAGRAGVPLIPMVKADAYGLGAVRVARALETLDPWAFGIATVAEGEQLRAAGITRRIMVFSPLLPDDFPAAIVAGLTPCLGSATSIRAWRAAGGGAWHLAIDTGMSRNGIRWDAVRELDTELRASPPEGAYTHFHSAERADGSRAIQEKRFAEALAALPTRPAVVHIENSPALERIAPPSHYTVVRPGIFLYGVGSGGGAAISPRPVVHMRARVAELRTIEDGDTVSYLATWRARGKRRIATVAAGYGDGYRRALGNRGTALVRGRRVPVVGVVTMDMTMLDVTDVQCEVGDVATLIGRDGDELLDVGSVAAAADSASPYELLTGLALRLPRFYLGGTEARA